MYEDKGGNIWIGTGQGLNYFDVEKNTFLNFGVADGLPSDGVFGILEDDDNNLWISTNKGLSNFNTKTRKIRNYTTADGLQSEEFKRTAYFKSRSGQLYFGEKWI